MSIPAETPAAAAHCFGCPEPAPRRDSVHAFRGGLNAQVGGEVVLDPVRHLAQRIGARALAGRSIRPLEAPARPDQARPPGPGPLAAHSANQPCDKCGPGSDAGRAGEHLHRADQVEGLHAGKGKQDH